MIDMNINCMDHFQIAGQFGVNILTNLKYSNTCLLVSQIKMTSDLNHVNGNYHIDSRVSNLGIHDPIYVTSATNIRLNKRSYKNVYQFNYIHCLIKIPRLK